MTMMTSRLSRDITVILLILLFANVVVIADPDNNHAYDSNHQELDRLIENVLQSSEHTLLDYEQYTSTTLVDPLLGDNIDHLKVLSNQISQLEATRDQLIHSINAQQMIALQDRLESAISSMVENLTTSDANNEYLNRETTATTAVTIPELEHRLAPESVLAESESILSNWIRSIIDQEINELDVEPIISSFTSKHQHAAVFSSSSDTSDHCISVDTVTKEVYTGLMRYLYDGIGLMDYTHSIVHQYTSPTYAVTDDDSSASSTLSTVWWNRYMPQDWESLLPHGWQSWKVWSFHIPDHIYHSLGGYSLLTRMGGGATCAPPEAILQASTLPGQCWPVSMRAKPAVVTIRLKAPIFVTAISIDHMSKLYYSKFKQQLHSAPKHVKVYGYPPCSNATSDDINCRSIGFDMMSKFLLAELTYSLDSEDNVQTFPIKNNKISRTAQVNDSLEGLCSETTTRESCGSQNAGVTAAVTFEIVDNWGNEDYTCLYRIRIHGEPFQS